MLGLTIFEKVSLFIIEGAVGGDNGWNQWSLKSVTVYVTDTTNDGTEKIEALRKPADAKRFLFFGLLIQHRYMYLSAHRSLW